jgi:serine/threonine protein kinase
MRILKKRVDILLEYVPGGSLSSLLKKFGPFNEKITKIYMAQMLDALAYIHSRGIAHRDIKCANVLINNDASIKISDFGASKKLTKNNDDTGYEMCKSLKGSPYWLAPEVASREGHDASVDIWSLGWWAIEMLTGRPPWSDRSKKASKVLSMIKNPREKISVPRGFSEEWYDFVFNSWLQRDPKHRWSAKELLHHPYLKKRLSSSKLTQVLPERKESNASQKDENKQTLDINQIRIEMPNQIKSISSQNENTGQNKNNEEVHDSAVPGPSIGPDTVKANDEDQKNNQEDEAFKTSNFSRWSDTQFDDGTCSLSFLKLWKTEEERAKLKELERLKLQNLLKLEIQSKAIPWPANPFEISKALPATEN